MNVKKKDTRYYDTLDSNTLNVTDNIVNLINYNSEKYYEYYGGTYYCDGKPFPGYTLHMPSDVVLTFYIPYIFLNKYAYEKEAYIFRHVNNWLFEPAFILFLTIDALLASGTCILTTYSIEGTFLHILNRYHIELSQPIVYGVNILAWSITLFFIGLSVYWLKCQFTASVKDWFFHKTWIGKFILYFSNKVEQIISTDLSDEILKKYIIFSICLILILAFISLLNIPFFSFFIVVISLIGISIVGYKKIKNVQSQYQDILHMTEDLSSGNFENIKPADSGLFQSLNNNIYQIKDGFEQAVKEFQDRINFKCIT